MSRSASAESADRCPRDRSVSCLSVPKDAGADQMYGAHDRGGHRHAGVSVPDAEGGIAALHQARCQ